MSNWQNKLAPEDPEKLAKRAIGLLEQRIEDEFGLHIQMGAELEFALSANDWLIEQIQQDKASPYNMLGVYKYKPLLEERYIPLKDKAPRAYKDFERDRKMGEQYFPNHPSIAYMYQESMRQWDEEQQHLYETHSTPALDHYEVVFSHLAGGGIKALLSSIETTKRQLRGEIPTNLTHKNGHTIRHFHPAFGDHVSFAPSIDRLDDDGKIAASVISGLQLNFSFTPAHGKPDELFQPVNEHANHCIYEAVKEAQLFLNPTDKHDERLHRLHASQSAHSSPVMVKWKDNVPEYSEIRCLPADCNSHMAAMVMLAGIYEGLRTPDKRPEYNDRPFYRWEFPTGADAKHEAFEQGSIIRKVLNEMEPELGDRFKAAITAKPRDQHTAQGRAIA